MAAEKSDNGRRPPLEELSPELRDAVERVLNDSMPEGLTDRALAAARARIGQSARRTGRRVGTWVAMATAASIVVMGTALYFHAGRVAENAQITSPAPVVIREQVGGDSGDALPTFWGYSQIVRRSPEAFEALLEQQAIESLAFDRRFPPEPVSVGCLGRSM
jgi:hypothetical protein